MRIRIIEVNGTRPLKSRLQTRTRTPQETESPTPTPPPDHASHPPTQKALFCSCRPSPTGVRFCRNCAIVRICTYLSYIFQEFIFSPARGYCFEAFGCRFQQLLEPRALVHSVKCCANHVIEGLRLYRPMKGELRKLLQLRFAIPFLFRLLRPIFPPSLPHHLFNGSHKPIFLLPIPPLKGVALRAGGCSFIPCSAIPVPHSVFRIVPSSE